MHTILKKSIKKFLIVRIHDNIKNFRDFALRPRKRPNYSKCLRIRPIVEGNSSTIKKQRCILYNYRIKSTKKTSKFQLLKTFIGLPILTTAVLEIGDSASRFLCHYVWQTLTKDQKAYFVIFEKSSNLKNFIKNFIQKNFNQTIQQHSSISKVNNNTTVKNFNSF